MEIVDFVPVCGSSMKKHRRKGTYHKLESGTDQRMLSLAEHVAHLNNAEICFRKKIHDDDVHLLVAS
ncbi:hypothetical protein CR513_57478, partial [Mucuna pruriens]